MRRTRFADMPCPIARALDAVGEWWTLLILREAHLGARRFDDFQERLGIARNILAARLKSLVADDILEKRAVPDEGLRRTEYCLTTKGRAIGPVLLALADWGNRFNDLGPSVSIETADSGEPVALRTVKLSDGSFVEAKNVRIRRLTEPVAS